MMWLKCISTSFSHSPVQDTYDVPFRINRIKPFDIEVVLKWILQGIIGQVWCGSWFDSDVDIAAVIVGERGYLII